MSMEVIEFDKYREIGRDVSEIKREHAADLNRGQLEFLEIKARRAETLQKIENVRGERFAVANDNGVAPGVAGFVTRAGIKPHFVESFLDHPDALKIASHEVGHVDDFRRGVEEISMKKNLEDEEFSILSDFMEEHGFDLENINLLEGFNELDGIKNRGVIEGCAYNKLEVPAAKLLEDTCRRDTGRSLREAYKSGNMDLFYELVKSLCAIINVRKEFKMAA